MVKGKFVKTSESQNITKRIVAKLLSTLGQLGYTATNRADFIIHIEKEKNTKKIQNNII